MIRLLLTGLLLLLSPVCLALNIRINFRWHNETIEIPSKKLISPSGETLSFTRVDLLLSQPHFTFESGQSLTASKWHAFINGEAVNILRFPRLPEEPISRLTIHLGPPEEINTASPNRYPAGHALNPIHNNLHWSPQQGYIFLALEGQLSEQKTAFAYHYGNSENRLQFSFDGPFDPTGYYQLTFHLDRLFPKNFNISKNPSTHSRPGDPVLSHFRQNLKQSLTLTPADRIESERSKEEQPKSTIVGTPYPFTIPAKVPLPELPSDFPLTNERVSLGKTLFFDPQLSSTNKISCASCHIPEKAFSDSEIFSKGINHQRSPRHSMPLFNLAWKHTPFRWDGDAPSLRSQILRPIEDPIEMGENLTTLPEKLSQQKNYPSLFEKAFGDAAITAERLAISIEQYILSLTSFDSKFDRVTKGLSEFSEQEQHGFQLFMTENDPRLGLRGADCFHCHSPPLFTNHRFHNNGLIPDNNDLGFEHSTDRATDRYRFSTPSLRNIAVTAPYMHDGRFRTLTEVIEHYSSGIHRSPTLDPNMAKHPGAGLNFSDEEKEALIAFLKTLTDSRFQKP